MKKNRGCCGVIVIFILIIFIVAGVVSCAGGGSKEKEANEAVSSATTAVEANEDVSISASESEEAATTEKIEDDSSIIATTADTSESSSVAEVLPPEEYAAAFERLLRSEGYEGITADYSSESQTLNIYYVIDGTTEVAMGAASGESDCVEAWEEAKEITSQQSIDFTNTFQGCYGDGYYVALWLKNNYNPDNVLLGAVNGVIIYDVVQ